MALRVRCRGDVIAEIPDSVLEHFITLVAMRECADPDGAGAGEDSATGHVVDAMNVSHDALESAIKFYLKRAKTALVPVEENTKFVVADEDAKFVATECSDRTKLTDLLCAANYLDARVLMNTVVHVIAGSLKDKSEKEILTYFDITGTFTPAEEQAALSAHPWLRAPDAPP